MTGTFHLKHTLRMTIDGTTPDSTQQLSGALVLHGFTGNLESVRELFSPIGDLGLRVVSPLLRGHGGESPENLRGVEWQDWLADAERGLYEACDSGERAVVIGHSMGALLALQLAARHPDMIDSLVLATPSFRLVSVFGPGRPLHFLATLISSVVDTWNFETPLADPENAIKPNHYNWAPTSSIISFFDLIDSTAKVLGQVRVPVLLLQGRRETIVLPESAAMLLDGIATSSEKKSVVWFEKTDHQIFCDCERSMAVATVVEFVGSRLALHAESPSQQSEAGVN